MADGLSHNITIPERTVIATSASEVMFCFQIPGQTAVSSRIVIQLKIHQSCIYWTIPATMHSMHRSHLHSSGLDVTILFFAHTPVQYMHLPKLTTFFPIPNSFNHPIHTKQTAPTTSHFTPQSTKWNAQFTSAYKEHSIFVFHNSSTYHICNLLGYGKITPMHASDPHLMGAFPIPITDDLEHETDGSRTTC